MCRWRSASCLRVFMLCGIWAAVFVSPSRAGEEPGRSRGQSLYVPAYSHIVHGDRGHPFLLTVTLCVRNPDPSRPIQLLAADYFDSKGVKIRGYVGDPISIPPMASAEFVVQESDKLGGVGAGFLVRWTAAGQACLPPVVETVMIGTAAAQGISFVSEARVIAEQAD
jgi:hypothetical protein